MSNIPSSVMPRTSAPTVREEQASKPGVLSTALWLAVAPVFIGVCLTGFVVSAVINGLTPKPAGVASTDEVPV